MQNIFQWKREHRIRPISVYFSVSTNRSELNNHCCEILCLIKKKEVFFFYFSTSLLIFSDRSVREKWTSNNCMNQLFSRRLSVIYLFGFLFRCIFNKFYLHSSLTFINTNIFQFRHFPVCYSLTSHTECAMWWCGVSSRTSCVRYYLIQSSFIDICGRVQKNNDTLCTVNDFVSLLSCKSWELFFSLCRLQFPLKKICLFKLENLAIVFDSKIVLCKTFT